MLGQPAPAGAEEAEKTARDFVRRGMPVTVIDRLAEAFRTSASEVQRIIGVSRATGTRRRTSKAPLRREASDRAFRMASVYTLAANVFEDTQSAREWFKEPNRALQGERPLDLLDTDVGTQQVVRILNRIEYGVYS
ncbi:MAG TPA: antitoxin Xre/MbcA/ParS toxin-binding domain-containing protein [Candidatus Cybelea sp.]|nr:antitoxin Xre/MbcA/ParS toxin-binding domain-containing protein [Candidatus Cybelea sp.]